MRSVVPPSHVCIPHRCDQVSGSLDKLGNQVVVSTQKHQLRLNQDEHDVTDLCVVGPDLRHSAEGVIELIVGCSALDEYRGSATIERYIDPADRHFNPADSLTQSNGDFVNPDNTLPGNSLESLYRFRTTNTKKFSP